MGEQFNIEDAETIRLAREIAGRSGKSMTATIRDALEREQTRIDEDVERRLVRVRELAREFREAMPPEMQRMTSKELMDAIYEDDWLK